MVGGENELERFAWSCLRPTIAETSHSIVVFGVIGLVRLYRNREHINSRLSLSFLPD